LAAHPNASNAPESPVTVTGEGRKNPGDHFLNATKDDHSGVAGVGKVKIRFIKKRAINEAIEIDLTKSIKKDFEKIKRPGVSPEMGMSLAASDPNLERMFAAELEDRKEVILGALDKLITASVEWTGKWNPNHPRAKDMTDQVAQLGKALAGIERALASRKQVDEAIEIDLAKSIKKDFDKIADYTSVPPEMAMALASSNPALEKMYIEYLRQQKPILDSVSPRADREFGKT
jgi:hypothetical protein